LLVTLVDADDLFKNEREIELDQITGPKCVEIAVEEFSCQALLSGDYDVFVLAMHKLNEKASQY
jgi:hypothetical protein